LNYRHHFHAGNFADVMKHALLVQLVRALERKPGGFFFLDTHAGGGSYDLARARQGGALARVPEHPEGIGRLWARDDLPLALAEYVNLVRAFDPRNEGAPAPRVYPGSPWIARKLMRPQDRMALCERQESEHLALSRSFAQEQRVSIQRMDGYVALRGMLPPPEKRSLALIDPPFESQDEIKQIIAALGEAVKRFPTGVFAIWYPLTGRVKAASLFDGLRDLPLLPPTLVADLIVDPESARMNGCGLVVLNPPWGFDHEAETILKYLARALGQAKGASATVRWLATERRVKKGAAPKKGAPPARALKARR
jgi:23S rRNA (adenine2030-N6)-methyltransferase